MTGTEFAYNKDGQNQLPLIDSMLHNKEQHMTKEYSNGFATLDIDLQHGQNSNFNTDTNSSPLNLHTPVHTSPDLNLYPNNHATLFNPNTTYGVNGASSYYGAAPHVFSNLDPGSRIGAGSSMAQPFRSSTTLPHPTSILGTRDLYTTSTPSYPLRTRDLSFAERSPPFSQTGRRIPGLPLSPATSPGLSYTSSLRMDAAFSSKAPQNIPPLQNLVMHGKLAYSDAPTTHVKPEVNGTIDKGFFLADNEWTCYRRNYFSCICSWTIAPPNFPNSTLHFTPTGQSQSYQVHSFAMCISAVVADNDAHAIDLVQHTPKRDKGPVAAPNKVQLNPKSAQASHNTLAHFQQDGMGLGGASRPFDQPFFGQSAPAGSFPTEHTFERIQFKQATANNGKRRAAQQFYHLLIELYADVGNQQGQGHDQFIKVAHRKSAKMIVRGRSPGHYQSERRQSTSSGGPSTGGPGSMAGYGATQMMGHEYGSQGGSMLGGGGYSGYDTRSGQYRTHQNELLMEPAMTAAESRSITETKDYQYYPNTIYENNGDARQPVEMFNHSQSRGGGVDVGNKLKTDYGGNLPSLFQAGHSYMDKPCGKFEGKSSSAGWYPVMPPASMGMSMT